MGGRPISKRGKDTFYKRVSATIKYVFSTQISTAKRHISHSHSHTANGVIAHSISKANRSHTHTRRIITLYLPYTCHHQLSPKERYKLPACIPELQALEMV